MSNRMSVKPTRFLAVAAASLALGVGIAYAAGQSDAPGGGPGWRSGPERAGSFSPPGALDSLGNGCGAW